MTNEDTTDRMWWQATAYYPLVTDHTNTAPTDPYDLPSVRGVGRYPVIPNYAVTAVLVAPTVPRQRRVSFASKRRVWD